jgi:hypothetical protein
MLSESKQIKNEKSGGISDLNKLRSERQAFKEQMQKKEGQISE